MPGRDPQIDAHLEWIGFVRPTGLVVSAPALVRAGAILPRDPEGQRLLRACVAERRFHPAQEPEPWLPNFRTFASSVLGWNFSPKGFAGTDDNPIPPELETPLQEGGEMLRPDFAVRERDPREDASPWQPARLTLRACASSVSSASCRGTSPVSPAPGRSMVILLEPASGLEPLTC